MTRDCRSVCSNLNCLLCVTTITIYGFSHSIFYSLSLFYFWRMFWWFSSIPLLFADSHCWQWSKCALHIWSLFFPTRLLTRSRSFLIFVFFYSTPIVHSVLFIGYVNLVENVNKFIWKTNWIRHHGICFVVYVFVYFFAAFYLLALDQIFFFRKFCALLWLVLSSILQPPIVEVLNLVWLRHVMVNFTLNQFNRVHTGELNMLVFFRIFRIWTGKKIPVKPVLRRVSVSKLFVTPFSTVHFNIVWYMKTSFVHLLTLTI